MSALITQEQIEAIKSFSITKQDKANTYYGNKNQQFADSYNLAIKHVVEYLEIRHPKE